MSVYRCRWCGRFYPSELPENTACPSHVHEWNALLMKSINEHNAKLAKRTEPVASPDPERR